MDFYLSGQVIFLTGGTGFIGKVILEKVLRSLPAVKKVSGDKTLEGRVSDEIFDTRIFETLKERFSSDQEFQEKVMSKVVPVRGDLALENLGLSAEDIKIVQADTTVLISNAATVSHTDPLRVAMNMNCYGTLRSLKLAQGMPRLAAVVHVSTSYVNTHLKGQLIKEEIYPFPLGDPEQIFDMLEKMTDEEIKVYERDVALKAFPNTYLVSKSITEHLIKSRYRSMNLPVVIVRPSIVGASYSEPIPGWAEGTGAFNGTIMLGAVGYIQEWIGDENVIIDVVPVDMVCNTILMSATQARRDAPTVPIFQIGTSTHNPVTLNRMFVQSLQYWEKTTLSLIPRFSDDIRADLYSSEDFEIRFKQKYTKELKIANQEGQEKLRKKLDRAYNIPKLMEFFLSGEWLMDASNSIALDNMAPPELHSELNVGFDWTKYIHQYNMGIHEFILRDEPDRNQVASYTWKSIQKKCSPSDAIAKSSRL
ncbi:cyclin-dependent kinase inhibitor far1 [Mortierella sp. AD094]|nr:cyclin-dependent kinase inhibitor far1 [Mortierella sp. AD094]